MMLPRLVRLSVVGISEYKLLLLCTERQPVFQILFLWNNPFGET